MADQTEIRVPAVGNQAFIDQLREDPTAMMWIGIPMAIVGIVAIVF